MSFEMPNRPRLNDSPNPHAGRADKPLVGRHILIVDDEVLLAMDLQYSVEEQGATVIGPGHSIKEACALIAAHEDIDAAILDVDLNGEEVFPVALRLRDAGVPFVFHTGHATREQLKAMFPDVAVCHKPVMPSEMIGRLQDLLDD